MRKITTLKSGRIALLGMYLIATVATLSLSSCAKDETTTTQVSGLTVINTSPTLGTYNVYLNTVQVNTAAIPFTGTIPYFQITPGVNTVKFTTASSTDNLLTKEVTLENDKAYSLFLIGKAGQLDGLLVPDDLSPVSANQAFIRFINLSPDAATLELSETGKAAIVKEEAYKSASPFVATEAKTYSFDLKDKVTGVVLKTLTGVTLSSGKMYTIAACGIVDATANDQPLRIQVFTNR
jgi:hypothetical protein